MRDIVLASTSPYRQELLRQLQVPFRTAVPRSTERIDQQVSPELLVKHLALEKAQSLQEFYPGALLIGADQVFVDARRRILGKPGSAEGAIQQLLNMAGRTHTFYTGLAVVDARSGRSRSDYATFAVTLRSLTEAQIRTYVERDKPWDCAGSFKIEGLGIALMEKMAGNDHTALIGLPLIKLTALLEEFGVEILGKSS